MRVPVWIWGSGKEAAVRGAWGRMPRDVETKAAAVR